MKISFIVPVLLLPTITYAFSTGAGGCAGGQAAVGGYHLRSSHVITTGPLEDYGLNFFISGAPAAQVGTPIVLKAGVLYDFQLTTGEDGEAGEVFRGFLIRLGGGSKQVDTTEALITYDTNIVQVSDICVDDYSVGGLTHTNPEEKGSMQGFIQVNEVSEEMPLDITVVVQNSGGISTYYYSQFLITVVAGDDPSTEGPNGGVSSWLGTLQWKYWLYDLSLVPSQSENNFILSAKAGKNFVKPERMLLNLTYGSFSLDDPLRSVCEVAGGTDLSVVSAWRQEDQAALEDLGITRGSYGYDSDGYAYFHQFSMTFSFNKNILSSPMFIPVGSSEGVVRFCARFTTADNNANVNQASMAVEMSVTLDGSFALEGIELHQVDITEDTGDEAFYGVTADNCGEKWVYFPGEPICIRVCANNYPATSIVDFVEMPLAYISGSAIDPSVSVTQDLTGCVGGKVSGVQCCKIQTLPYENEYPTVFGEVNPKVYTGTVTLALTGNALDGSASGNIQLPRFAGTYDAQMMRGGWDGTWGNGGTMSFEITCSGQLIITMDGAADVNTEANYGTDKTNVFWSMPTGDTERWVNAEIAETFNNVNDEWNPYFFGDFPGSGCEGGCMRGTYDPRDGTQGQIDFRAHATSRTECPLARRLVTASFDVPSGRGLEEDVHNQGFSTEVVLMASAAPTIGLGLVGFVMASTMLIFA